jgi:hypothetical protein
LPRVDARAAVVINQGDGLQQMSRSRCEGRLNVACGHSDIHYERHILCCWGVNRHGCRLVRGIAERTKESVAIEVKDRHASGQISFQGERWQKLTDVADHSACGNQGGITARMKSGV